MNSNQSEEVFTPQIFLEKYLRRRNISVEEIGVAPRVVLSWGYGIIRSLAAQTGAEIPEHWMYGKLYPMYTGKIGGVSVSFVEMPVGAAGTVMVMEELIACGARTFIGLGWAGSLQPDLSIGSLVIPTSCIREEGTSFHYLDDSHALHPDLRLQQRLIESAITEGASATPGPLWTTDAPYRELRSKVERYRGNGVLGVDMETSAMYAIGLFRKVAVCNLMVVSDMLGAEWHEGFASEALEQANKRAEKIVLRSIENEKRRIDEV
ncbi:MAG: nucleoside phosphorylase [Ignavibacteriales bacterium]|nr:nucleoside phosphorylase [Ignavibacteriales bacterium]